jgi:hypothetical protein
MMVSEDQEAIIPEKHSSGIFRWQSFRSPQSLLPKEKWGVVIRHYEELYPKRETYTDPLRALEKARKEKSESPALRLVNCAT